MHQNVYPTVAQITQLPRTHQTTVGPEHLDAMGHMNVRWYLGFFDEGTWHLFESFGMDLAYFKDNHAGAFALRQVINYLAEVRAGEGIAIHSRMLGRSAKRVHFMHFMVNETTGRLAATLEALGSHADLTVRRTSPMPASITSRLDALLAAHQALAWPAPRSGIIEP